MGLGNVEFVDDLTAQVRKKSQREGSVPDGN
jgi:hypothetical protein